MNLVYENLNRFKDYQFFNMFEEEKDQDDMKIVKKCEQNFNELKKEAKDNIHFLKQMVEKS